MDYLSERKMMLLFCAIFFCVNTLVVYGSGNQCFQRDKLPHMVRNSELRHPSFKSVTSLGPIDCARQCKLHTLCEYVNFNIETLTCSLIATHSVPQSIANSVSLTIDVKSWNKNILQACKNHLCPNNTVCIEDKLFYECKPIGCTRLPQVQNINVTSFTSKDLWGFGEVVEYACNRGYYTETNATCTSSGYWSNVQCQRYDGCRDIEVCSEFQKKEFWLYLSNTLHKIFCEKLTTYFSLLISLPEYNMASTPIFKRYGNSCERIEASKPDNYYMGYTDFQKIRYFKSIRRIKTYEFGYSNSSFSLQDYGRAGDCYAGNDSSVCGVLGHFIINLKGTGFKVSPSVQWKTWGTDGVIHNITWSDEGRVIEGYCGGNCGGCEPEGNLILETAHNDTPAFESAELPICKFPI